MEKINKVTVLFSNRVNEKGKGRGVEERREEERGREGRGQKRKKGRKKEEEGARKGKKKKEKKRRNEKFGFTSNEQSSVSFELSDLVRRIFVSSAT